MRWSEKGLRIWVLAACIVAVISFFIFTRRAEGFNSASDEAAINLRYKGLISAQNTVVQAAAAALQKAKDDKTTKDSADTASTQKANSDLQTFLEKNNTPAIKQSVDTTTADNNAALTVKKAATQKLVDDATLVLARENRALNRIIIEYNNALDTASLPAGSLPMSGNKRACAELANLRADFLSRIATVRAKMADLSGTEVLGVALKGENMRFQNRYASACDNLVNSTQGTGLTDVAKRSCIGLASQDDPLYNSLIPAYDTTNTQLYTQDITLSDNVDTINDTMTLIKCDISGIVYSADDSIGSINVDEIKEKLNELSPYYISSGTLDYITKYLVGNGLLDTALYSSTQILTEVNASLKRSKVLADKIFIT